MTSPGDNSAPLSLTEELSRLQQRYPIVSTREDALSLALQCAELQMKFLKLAKDPELKKELTHSCNSLLDEAERIKSSHGPISCSTESLLDLGSHKVRAINRPTSSSTRSTISSSFFTPPQVYTSGTVNASRSSTSSRNLISPISRRTLPRSEELLLYRASKLNRSTFPPWERAPALSEFELSPEGYLFCEQFDMALSAEQQDMFTAWERPDNALPPPSSTLLNRAHDNGSTTITPTMTSTYNNDFVQDAATDCSVVASLSAAMACAGKAYNTIPSAIFHPYDREKDRPLISKNGKYIVKAYFNGCFRKVVVDDRLPTTKTNRTMHVWDRNNPSLLWPAILEKAYLKIRGGYDFPGSNSGTDLWIIMGWIPEQIFIEPDVDLDGLWTRIYKAYQCGDVIITMGTGATSLPSEIATGLVGHHDYAVLDLAEKDGQKQVQIKNSWLNSTSQTGHEHAETKQRFEAKSDNDSAVTVRPEHQTDILGATGPVSMNTAGNARPGVFWMDFNTVGQHFDSLYFNWNPALFTDRYDIHFSWDLRVGAVPGRSPPASFNRNPQFSLSSSAYGEVWLIITKHFLDKASIMPGGTEELGYINLFSFGNDGYRQYLNKNPLQYGQYVDSPQSLLRITLESDVPQTIIIAEQQLPEAAYTFTLSAFVRTPLNLTSAVRRLAQSVWATAKWDKDTSGGNANASTYTQNPQFKLTLNMATAVALFIETDSAFPINVKLCHSRGQRLASISTKDIIIDAGDYQYGAALAESRESLQAGNYTVICSTYEVGQEGHFRVQADTMDPDAKLELLPKDGAGRLRIQLADISFAQGNARVAAPIHPTRLAKIRFTSTNIGSIIKEIPLSSPSPMRLSVELGSGPNRRYLETSGDGSFSPGALRTEDVDIRPEMSRETLWLVLERIGGLMRQEERVCMEMLVDTPDAVAVGVWRRAD